MIATILSGYLQQFFMVFYFWVFLGDIGVGGLFLLSCRPPCFQQYLVSASVLVFSWGYLIIQERHFFRVFFQWLILILIYYYIYIIHFCLVFFTRFGFLQLPHTYITIVSGFVLRDLVDMLLSLNLPCIILLSFTLKIFFPQDFSFLFETNCKNCKKYFMSRI